MLIVLVCVTQADTSICYTGEAATEPQSAPDRAGSGDPLSHTEGPSLDTLCFDPNQ